MLPRTDFEWPRWIRPFTWLTFLYHAGWGIFFILQPAALFAWIGWEGAGPELLVQGLGGGLIVLALGYAMAGRWPLQHWGFILLGVMLKAGAAFGSMLLLILGKLPVGFWAFTLANDVAWLLPFGMFLYAVYKRHPGHQVQIENAGDPLPEGLETFTDQKGQSLVALQTRQPVLLVFLRHFGCTFCRETMADLARNRKAIAEAGVYPVVVHQSSPERADTFFAQYNLEHTSRISDPEQNLYQAFSLYRGSIAQMFGWKSWLRGLRAGVWDGHWVGKEEGDGWQMPGAFLLFHNRIERAYIHKTAADRVDYQVFTCDV
ncbi:MAG: peroxiredoxin-like family protein [Bacteroidota bacterium]